MCKGKTVKYKQKQKQLTRLNVIPEYGWCFDDENSNLNQKLLLVTYLLHEGLESSIENIGPPFLYIRYIRRLIEPSAKQQHMYFYFVIDGIWCVEKRYRYELYIYVHVYKSVRGCNLFRFCMTFSSVDMIECP